MLRRYPLAVLRWSEGVEKVSHTSALTNLSLVDWSVDWSYAGAAPHTSGKKYPGT